MEDVMTAIEITGTIDEHRRLELDEALPVSGPMRVRVIVMYPSEEARDEKEWLYAATHNPAFDYLSEPEENIYSLSDGEPFHDEV